MTTITRGTVYLVGAGPGDPELLTRKAAALLAGADLVLHDDLVPAAILALAPHSMLVNVGKRCGAKKITQAQIHEMMTSSARHGMSVVRLKSGDPAIFGRLAEEIDALRAAGVPFEVVPGVTAALAAAASVQASLTDRRTTSRLLLISAHHAEEKQAAPRQDWRALISADTSVAVYMPGHDFAPLQQDLLAGGLSPQTPCVVVSRAGTPDEEQIRTVLGRLVATPPMPSPTILLIGRTLGRDAQPAEAALQAAIGALQPAGGLLRS